jgi:hypothetical protein
VATRSISKERRPCFRPISERADGDLAFQQCPGFSGA